MHSLLNHICRVPQPISHVCTGPPVLQLQRFHVFTPAFTGMLMHRSMSHHQHLESGMQANQIGHIVCSCCDITLMYAFGAASVKCAVCNTVTHVNHATLTHPSAQQGPSNSSAGVSAGASPRPQQSHQTVVIVNPPTLDAEGNEVSAAF